MFLQTPPHWNERGAAIIAELSARFGAHGLAADRFALVLLQAGPDGRPQGFAHRGDWRGYPCSLVKTFHLVHALVALDRGQIAPHPELDRALGDMIVWSSNTATNYVIDLLTGTTGDTLLEPDAMADWMARREGLNRFFAALGWPEFDGCNLTQKLMDDTRYGREAQFAAQGGGYLNKLTPLAAARLMWELFEGGLPLSDPARAQATLRRDRTGPDAALPPYQLAGYLGGALPEGVEVWSKAGHNSWTGDPRTSWFKHDMIRMAARGQKPLTAVLMTEGCLLADTHPEVFPEAGRLIFDMVTTGSRPEAAHAG